MIYNQTEKNQPRSPTWKMVEKHLLDLQVPEQRQKIYVKRNHNQNLITGFSKSYHTGLKDNCFWVIISLSLEKQKNYIFFPNENCISTNLHNCVSSHVTLFAVLQNTWVKNYFHIYM